MQYIEKTKKDFETIKNDLRHELQRLNRTLPKGGLWIRFLLKLNKFSVVNNWVIPQYLRNYLGLTSVSFTRLKIITRCYCDGLFFLNWLQGSVIEDRVSSVRSELGGVAVHQTYILISFGIVGPLWLMSVLRLPFFVCAFRKCGFISISS